MVSHQVSLRRPSIPAPSLAGRLLATIAASVLVLAACLPAPLARAPEHLQRPPAAPSLSVPGAPPIKVLTGPVPFPIEQNVGQADPGVHYLLRAGSLHVGFASGGPRLVLTAPVAASDAPCADPRHAAHREREQAACPTAAYMLALSLVGADTTAPVGVMPAETVVSRLVGREDRWQSDIPTFEQIVYPNAWPGIDVLYERAPTPGGLKSGYRVAPGADPSAIHLAWHGAGSAVIDEDGALLLTTPVGTVRESAPVAWQDDPDGGHTPIAARFTLYADGRDGQPVEVGFTLGRFDPSRPLTIDPVITYGSYLGGSDFDQAFRVAVDGSGNAFVVGRTISTNFPTTPGAFDTTWGGGSQVDYDAFVAKVNTSGSALVYATYLGGSNSDEARNVAVDGGGNAYVVGFTQSSDFPTTSGAAQRTPSTIQAAVHQAALQLNGFVVKVNAAGSGLVYSTYVDASLYGVAVDSGGNAYVVGLGAATSTPPIVGDSFDAFLAKVNATGSALVYTFSLRGNANDEAMGVAVDSSGNAYVVGTTASTSFPTTPGAFATTLDGGLDAFVAKVNAAGSGLVYSTYLGGREGYGVAIDSGGNAYVVGYGGPFPTTPGAFDPTPNGDLDAFVAKVNATGSGLVYASYLGGSYFDIAYSVAVDGGGNAYVVGGTGSRDFPTTFGAFQTTFGGGNVDGFVAKVNADGSALAYASYLGGVGEDDAAGVAVDRDGNAYVVGDTGWQIPTTAGAFDTTFNGGSSDAFVVKVNPSLSTPAATATSTPTATATTTLTAIQTPTITQTPTATPTPTRGTNAPPPSEDDADKPRKQTEQARRQQQHTNASNLDQYHTEGTVTAVASSTGGNMLLVTIALGRGETLILEIGCPGAVCPDVQPGDYLDADGEQGGRDEQGHFLVEDLTITRNGHRVR